MNESMIPIYTQMLDNMKQCGIRKILCSELYARYCELFNNNYEIFKNALDYLEEQGALRIERINVGIVFPHSVEVVY